jgi:hypothetical protein
VSVVDFSEGTGISQHVIDYVISSTPHSTIFSEKTTTKPKWKKKKKKSLEDVSR